jgi:hypothetical protein
MISPEGIIDLWRIVYFDPEFVSAIYPIEILVQLEKMIELYRYWL